MTKGIITEIRTLDFRSQIGFLFERAPPAYEYCTRTTFTSIHLLLCMRTMVYKRSKKINFRELEQNRIAIAIC